MDTTSQNLQSLRDDLLIRFYPYAKKAGRSAFYRYGLDQDDIAHDIMIEVIRNADRALEAESPIAWLVSRRRYFMGHALQRIFRRRDWEKADQMADGFDVVSPPSPDLETAMTVAKAVAKLSEIDRKSFSCLYIWGMTKQETADKLGIPVGSVSHSAKRAKDAAMISVGLMEPRIGRATANKARAATDTYVFQHDDWGAYKGTAYDFRIKYSLPQPDISKLLKGKRSHVKGWRLG